MMLTERDKALYRLVKRAAEAGEPAPSHADLAARLAECGHSAARGSITYIIDKLSTTRPRLIEVVRDDGQYIYRIPGTRHQTAPRLRSQRPEHAAAVADAMAAWSAQRQGWPIPTPDSAASYDAAVARREFAKHESGETPEPIRAVRPAYGARSLVGCSADFA